MSSYLLIAMKSYLCGHCKQLAKDYYAASESDFEPYDGSKDCNGVDVPNKGIYNDDGHARAQYKGNY